MFCDPILKFGDPKRVATPSLRTAGLGDIFNIQAALAIRGFSIRRLKKSPNIANNKRKLLFLPQSRPKAEVLVFAVRDL